MHQCLLVTIIKSYNVLHTLQNYIIKLVIKKTKGGERECDLMLENNIRVHFIPVLRD
jgi:hypothetical protein